jgi:polyphosphate kinase
MPDKPSVDKPSSPEVFNLDEPRFYINRELSALEFQRRVLDEAKDPSTPLLERVKFLAIVGSNLDEFFMVRVAGLKKQIDASVTDLPPDGMTPAEQLASIRKVASDIMQQVHDCWVKDVMPALKDEGIHILSYSQLNGRQRGIVGAYFNEVVFPVLTPLAFDPGHPFPHISNLSLNLAVMVRDKKGKERFARIKVPGTLPRLVPIKRSSGGQRKNGTVPHDHYFVWLEQVIAANLPSMFPGMDVIESHAFRITRDADLEIQELEADDLLESMENSVRQRRFGSVVRVGINANMPSRIRQILIENLEISPHDVYIVDGPLGMSTLMGLSQIERYDLREVPYKPVIPATVKCNGPDEQIFEMIQCGDILLHHPYDSFEPVIDFLEKAATDPDVLAIKQTLYRVGKNPPVVNALLNAAENHKQVAVLVELKARFDEESNIGWARKLESEGVHVVYGLLGLKTHSKIVLVVRKEGDGIRRYLHLSTGNYNAITANLYEDIGMFTCDPEIGADATDLFNYLTGYSSKQNYRKLLVAPINLRQRMEALIQREIELQKQGEQGYLIFKVNSIADQPMIRQLYEASQAGVKVDLITRGICCLRPGIPGVSENIRVLSVVGRYLEHSRIYYFRNGGREEIYLGSADLMERNIYRRVEVLFPVQDPTLIRTIRDDILEIYLNDNVKARLMKPDGKYERVLPEKGAPLINSQEWFMRKRYA